RDPPGGSCTGAEPCRRNRRSRRGFGAVPRVRILRYIPTAPEAGCCPGSPLPSHMTSTRATPLTAVRLVREVLALDGDPGPEALLRSGSAGPRGFWGEGPGDWVAWRGSLLSLRVDAELGGGDRFERVLEEAGRVELSGEG